MTDKIYNWKRFWCLRTAKFTLDERGYLSDKDSIFGDIENPDLATFESISVFPCLILLGEPGIGKSSAMEAEKNSIDTEIKSEGDQTLWINLRSYGNEVRLIHDLFENPIFVTWINGNHQLHIFLDSLDECLLRIDTISTLLIDEFKKYIYSVDRLCLRIACRTADWPNIFEDGLKQLWGNTNVEIYELAPLRLKDVEEAAKVNNINQETFLREIEQKEVVPFAIKPITLNFLLNIYLETGQFPQNRTELYFQGCKKLCEETSKGRRGSRQFGDYSADQRLLVAARIAALTIFTNRFAVWTEADLGDVPKEDVTFNDLGGGNESINGNQFQIIDSAIRETIGTGLFSSRGMNRMGWAHQTYAEFLAAYYLKQHNLTIDQIMCLLIHPNDPEGKLVPQLYETAAWLASIMPGVFKCVMSSDPEILLRSDLTNIDLKYRAELVDTLLKLFNEEKLLDRYYVNRNRYKQLIHPSLDEQLRPYICNKTKGVAVRQVAIDIAESCEVKELENELVGLALDLTEPYSIRVNAANAVVNIGDDETKAKLKPLAIGEAGDDPDDELKGCGLFAVWPNHLTAKELFNILTYPKRKSLFGMYYLFISEHVIKHIKINDLPFALNWVEKHLPKHALPIQFQKLANEIMMEGWKHIDLPEVIKSFARVVLSSLRCYDEIIEEDSGEHFKTELGDNDIKRRSLIKEIIPLISDVQKDTDSLVHIFSPVVMSKDVPWMIETLQSTESEITGQVLIQLIIKAFDWKIPGQLDIILEAGEKYHLLNEAFSSRIRPINLNSTEAQELKDQYEKIKKFEKRNRHKPLLQPPLNERIELLLNKFESEDLNAWWQLNMELTLKPDSTHYENEAEADLTILPGWKDADEITKKRIVECAKKYIIDQNPQINEWLGTNILHRPVFAGYRALFLLLKEDHDFISSISDEIWKKWAPIIIAYPLFSSSGDETPHHRLVTMVYQHAPDEIINALIRIIDKENREHSFISVLNKIKDCWDERLANALINKLKDETLKPGSIGGLLEVLLEHDISEAKNFAEALVSLPIPLDEDVRLRAKAAASVLMTHTKDVGWSIVWPIITQDVKLGKSIFESIVYGSNSGAKSIIDKLTEDQLADLYIWLVQQYPYEKDSKDEGVHAGGPDEVVAHWRDTVLNYLEQKGTFKSCNATERIYQEFPEHKWLKRILLESQEVTRRHTWIPPQPHDILKMVSDRQSRLVQNGDQLLDVLIESLKRLEEMLQGESPEAKFLWNELPDHIYRPKEENDFSDYVKGHLENDLKQRGVIVNREVEIRSYEGGQPGEKTDIHVDAVVKDARRNVLDSISAIIEVKGCWHSELKTSMKSQLVDRYLKDNPSPYGIYLIGWFYCKQWDENDGRKRKVPKLTKETAQAKFDAQANELSQGGIKVRTLVINTALR